MNNSLKFLQASVLRNTFDYSLSFLNTLSSSTIESSYYQKILSPNQIIVRKKQKSRIASMKNYNSSSRPNKHLHLLVHGSKGGKIHSSLCSLVDELRTRGKRSVSIEALTNQNPQRIDAGNRSILLVPLFLLPGNHVVLDVPTIFKRYTSEGANIKLYPFLGSSPLWLSLLGDFVTKQNTTVRPALIHHPVNSARSNYFLRNLERFLKIPVISGAKWNQDGPSMWEKFFPVPYILTPNKNVQVILNGFQQKSLLENEIIRFELVNILGNLP